MFWKDVKWFFYSGSSVRYVYKRMILVSEGAKRHTREAETRFRVVVKFQDG